jgi:hypothetical protein
MKVAARVGTFVPCEAYLKYRWSIFRFFDDRTLSKVSRVIHAIRSIQHIDLNKIEARFPKSYLPLLKKVREFNLFSRPAKISYLKKLLIKLGGLSSETKWARYHDEFIQENKVISSPRFDYIADKLISLGVQSALEIAGNQGVLCSLLELKNDSISLICTDGDSNAVDKGYKLARNRGSKINWAVLNPFVFETSDSEIPVSDRFRSEAVLALALTHHLVLTQNFRLSNIFSTIKKFTSNYIFIEFMPMGLYNGVSAPQLPSWYSEKWFENEFLEHFELIEKKILEKNRVLFVGKVYKPRGRFSID